MELPVQGNGWQKLQKKVLFTRVSKKQFTSMLFYKLSYTMLYRCVHLKCYFRRTLIVLLRGLRHNELTLLKMVFHSQRRIDQCLAGKKLGELFR